MRSRIGFRRAGAVLDGLLVGLTGAVAVLALACSSTPRPAQTHPSTPPSNGIATTQAPPGSQSGLWFRVHLQDQNGDQVLTGGESLTLTVEVLNAGATRADDVVIHLSGTPALLQQFPQPLQVGTVHPGERKRIQASAIIPDRGVPNEVELVLSLAGSSAASGTGSVKKFLLPVRAGRVMAQADQLDRIPKPNESFRRPDRVGMAIGVGRFREPSVPALSSAPRDAALLARYLTAIGGMQPDHVKVLTDDQAFKDDILDALETWLPRQASTGGMAIVYFSGWAVVDPATGVVSLLPYEGRPDAPFRQLSLRRVQAGLARLPVRQAVLLLDLQGVVGPNGPAAGTIAAPSWDLPASGTRTQKLIQLVGLNGHEPNPAEPDGHGPFTGQVLLGLQGEADQDKDGTISLGELSLFLQQANSRAAQPGQEADLTVLTIPSLQPGSTAWTLPVAKLR
ncbi:MAG: hypothetical protein ACREI3_06950 [Nitrospirales bacterium]